jgi:hypothetical protein
MPSVRLRRHQTKWTDLGWEADDLRPPSIFCVGRDRRARQAPRRRVVADWAALDRRKATAPARALPGRPSLVASRDELDFGKSANVVPAALLLWALSG